MSEARGFSAKEFDQLTGDRLTAEERRRLPWRKWDAKHRPYRAAKARERRAAKRSAK